jgi:RNA polymerase primary sigma factor
MKKPSITARKGRGSSTHLLVGSGRRFSRKAMPERIPANGELPAREDSEPLERPEAGRNAYTLYLREIGQTRLLTPEEEIQLARRIKKGDVSAQQEMIKANLRLVVSIAREYENYGVPLLDLINEGNIGLMKAIERFDPDKGAKLSTYAAWWIKQCIRHALATQARTIRLPDYVTASLFKLHRVAAELQARSGREATDQELARQLDCTPAQIARLRRSAASISSLDAPLTDAEDSGSFADVVEDELTQTPYELLERKTRVQTLRQLLMDLPNREASILRLRFGVNGGEKKTLEQIGRQFGVTRERIRQLEYVALKKLRQLLASREAGSSTGRFLK